MSDPVFELFVLHFFDNCLSPGGQAGEIRAPLIPVGYPLDTRRIPVREENRSRIVFWRSWACPGGLRERFGEPPGANVARKRVPEASGIDFGRDFDAFSLFF